MRLWYVSSSVLDDDGLGGEGQADAAEAHPAEAAREAGQARTRVLQRGRDQRCNELEDQGRPQRGCRGRGQVLRQAHQGNQQR